MLPEASRQPDGSIVRRNRQGGTVRFIPSPSVEALAEALEIPGEAPDIGFAAGAVPLRCMHKVLDGRDIYYLANLVGLGFRLEPSRYAGKNGSRYGTRIRRDRLGPIPSPAARAGTARRKSDCVSNRTARCFW